MCVDHITEVSISRYTHQIQILVYLYVKPSDTYQYTSTLKFCYIYMKCSTVHCLVHPLILSLAVVLRCSNDHYCWTCGEQCNHPAMRDTNMRTIRNRKFSMFYKLYELHIRIEITLIQYSPTPSFSFKPTCRTTVATPYTVEC